MTGASSCICSRKRSKRGDSELSGRACSYLQLVAAALERGCKSHISRTRSEQKSACASLPQLCANSTTLRSASLIFTTRPPSLSFSRSTSAAQPQCCYPYSSCCKSLQIPRFAQCRVGVMNLHEQLRASAAPRSSYDHTAFLTQTSLQSPSFRSRIIFLTGALRKQPF